MWLSLGDTIVVHLKAGTCIVKVELVTTLKRQATKILQDLHTSKEPVLITEHGQPSAWEAHLFLVGTDEIQVAEPFAFSTGPLIPEVPTFLPL